jgi:hypothetical protein
MLTCQCQGRLHLFNRLHFDATFRGPAPKARRAETFVQLENRTPCKSSLYWSLRPSAEPLGLQFKVSPSTRFRAACIECVSGGTQAKKITSPRSDALRKQP